MPYAQQQHSPFQVRPAEHLSLHSRQRPSPTATKPVPEVMDPSHPQFRRHRLATGHRKAQRSISSPQARGQRIRGQRPNTACRPPERAQGLRLRVPVGCQHYCVYAVRQQYSACLGMHVRRQLPLLAAAGVEPSLMWRAVTVADAADKSGRAGRGCGRSYTGGGGCHSGLSATAS